MTEVRRVAVIDIGKTNAKVALVDLATLAESEVATMPNRVVTAPPYPHFDVPRLWSFILAALRRLAAGPGVDAIAITTHGACAALLDRQGGLAAPVLDYEFPGPEATRDAYDALRPGFAETGSPRLPLGLNLGAQLHWQMTTMPGLGGRVADVVTWPQYWAFRLTGVRATDPTSLGCHTDLWNPWEGRPSALVARLGLDGRIAPTRAPADILGTVTAEVAAETGLSPETPVACGIHDSNASLLPHLMGRPAPFAVVSTGTWVVAMAVGGRAAPLDPGRDTLVNVDAFGAPVRSARFMGGREYEIATGGRTTLTTAEDEARVLGKGAMLLPSLVRGSGPFPDRTAGWRPAGLALTAAETEVAVGFYLGLMSATCLGMIGAAGPVIVEGSFARNPFFRRMLAAATGRPVIASAARTGTAAGAALLFRAGPPALALAEASDDGATDGHRAYAATWQHAVAPQAGEG